MTENAGQASGATGIRLSDVPGVLRLCEAWRRESMARGWTAGDDWRVNAVEVVATAAWRRAGLPSACGLLGRERGRAGIGIGEALTDLGALCHVLTGGEPPLELVQPLSEGWAEAGLAQLSDAACEDPLTGCATLPYLKTRLGEVYREARWIGRGVAGTYRLLVAELPGRLDAWDRMTVLMLVSNDLRAAFPGGETLSLAGRSRAVVLVPVRPELPVRVARLRESLGSAYSARLRLVTLPPRHEEALRLLAGLAC